MAKNIRTRGNLLKGALRFHGRLQYTELLGRNIQEKYEKNRTGLNFFVTWL